LRMNLGTNLVSYHAEKESMKVSVRPTNAPTWPKVLRAISKGRD